MNKRENMDEMAVRRMEVPNAVLLGQVKEAIREAVSYTHLTLPTTSRV